MPFCKVRVKRIKVQCRHIQARDRQTDSQTDETYLDSVSVWDGVDEWIKVKRRQIRVLSLNEYNVRCVIPGIYNEILCQIITLCLKTRKSWSYSMLLYKSNISSTNTQRLTNCGAILTAQFQIKIFSENQKRGIILTMRVVLGKAGYCRDKGKRSYTLIWLADGW